MNYDKWLEWREREIARSGVFIPTASREEFAGRDLLLKEAGFLEWERKWFVARDFSGPGIQLTIKDRNEIKLAAKLSFANWNKYQRDIGKKYADRNWFTRDGRKNPFRMLDAAIARDNISETPQPKRGHRPTDFVGGKKATQNAEAKRERTMANARATMAKRERR